jgi:RNA polymerase sigma-70 factor (ECF subfamily)
VVRRAEDREVLAAISKLSSLDQEVIRLAVWEELPQTGIGEVIGCSDRAVTMRLHRAKRRLARHLRTGGTETPIRPAIEQREAQHE